MIEVTHNGRSFITREGDEAVSRWEEICGVRDERAAFLITFADGDGDDGLAWLSWEEADEAIYEHIDRFADDNADETARTHRLAAPDTMDDMEADGGIWGRNI
jgi:hypothetical protein